MEDPIKTTTQEALEHIKEWIAKGEKDKALRGLQEVVNFDPSNAEAQKMLTELQATATITTAAPAASVTPPSTVKPGVLDVSIGSPAPVSPAPVTITPPVPTPAPAVVAPKPVPAIPTPAPISAPVVAPAPAPAPTLTRAPAPSIPRPTPSVSTPAMSGVPASPFKPLSAAPEVLTKAMERGEPEVSVLNKVQSLSQNMRWAIFVGVLAAAIIGGFLFYKTFLSTSQPLSSDIQKQVENGNSPLIPSESSSEDNLTDLEPIGTTDTQSIEEALFGTVTDSGTDTTGDSPITDDTSTSSSDSTSTSSPSDESGEKVKRR